MGEGSQLGFMLRGLQKAEHHFLSMVSLQLPWENTGTDEVKWKWFYMQGWGDNETQVKDVR